MITLFKNIGWFFKQNKKHYSLLVVILFVIAFLTTLTPALVGRFIDHLTQGTLDFQVFYVLVFALLLVGGLLYVLNYYFHYHINYKGQILSRKLRLLYIGKLFSHDSKLFEEYSKGELISRLSNDMLSITSVATTVFTDSIYCFSLIFVLLIIMTFTISWKLTIAAFVIIPLTFVGLNYLRNYMRKYYKTHRKIYAKYYDMTLESIEGSRVVRAYAQEDKDIAKNTQAINDDINSWKKIIRFENIFVPLFDSVLSISIFITYTYGSYLVIIGEITPGELVTFAMYITMISGPIMVLANVYNLLSQAQIGSERYFEILNKEPEVKDDEDSKSVLEFKHLEYVNVGFKYPFDQHATLKGINIDIYAGETIGFVGPTGSGKSTIIRQLLREFNVTSGNIILNDEDIKNYKLNSVRSLVGYVPQEHILFKGSVAKNLEVGSPVASESSKTWAIQVAAFENDLKYMNDGLTTPVGERGSGLSGGQKQRLSIARALVKDPSILILDDSLSAVDANTERTIISNIKEHRKGKTNIIITHRFSVVTEAHKIYVVIDGQIVDSGTHYELINRDGWYKQQYENQKRGSNGEL